MILRRACLRFFPRAGREGSIAPMGSVGNAAGAGGLVRGRRWRGAGVGGVGRTLGARGWACCRGAGTDVRGVLGARILSIRRNVCFDPVPVSIVIFPSLMMRRSADRVADRRSRSMTPPARSASLMICDARFPDTLFWWPFSTRIVFTIFDVVSPTRSF